MGVTIHVNGTSNSLVHKGSMGIAKSTLPDVCKTPSPGGPVPIPYPVIISMSSDLKKGTKTVKVDGKKMAAVKGSEFSRCSGDEPGTAGGVKSSTNMKEATWLLYSFDVKLDGKNACRLSDKMMMNHGNTACLGGEMQAAVARRKSQLQKIVCECDAEIASKNEDGTPNKRTCQFLGELKHKCCEAKIRDKTKQGSKSGIQGETGYTTDKPAKNIGMSRGAAKKAGQLKGTSWPDACITDGSGNPVKLIDFKFKCPKDSPTNKSGGVCSGTQPTPSWTKYSAKKAKATGFVSQKEKYKDLSKRLGLDPNTKENEPEIINNDKC